MRTALRTIILAIREAWNPRTALFGNGEVGVWLDCSDLTTMFQDAAGTTPVTAVEQPVGLILDKSKGLVLGAELVSNPGPFTVTTGWSVFDGGGLSVVSSKLRITSSKAYSRASTPFTTVIGKTYKFSVNISGVSGVTTQTYIQKSDDASGAVNAKAGPIGGSRTATLYAVATATTTYLSLVNGVSTNPVIDYDNISVRELPGAHAVQATAASRPTLKLIDGKYSLLFDGIDDGLSTASIDFTSTAQMTVVAGVRKLSDSGNQTAFELSAAADANAGTFFLMAPAGGFANYQSLMRGATGSNTATPAIAAPDTATLSMAMDLGGQAHTMRRNGAFSATGTGEAGFGSFGNYPLYIGSRAGTSLPFNGHIYSLIVRGAQSTDAQIVAAEKFTATKAGVVL